MPHPIPAPPRRIPVEPLTAEAYAPFGTVVENPANLPNKALAPSPVPGNQGSALVYRDISRMTNFYSLAPSNKAANAIMNMFDSAPRELRVDGGSEDLEGEYVDDRTDQTLLYDVTILERHPFTSQTFIPLGVSPTDQSTKYLVIVAPTLPPSSVKDGMRPPPFPGPKPRKQSMLESFVKARPSPFTNESLPSSTQARQRLSRPKGSGLPDLQGIRAFIASGNQAVTYGAGTWHAPMVVLGDKNIQFVVTQFSNGVGLEDVQEVSLTPQTGEQASISVVIGPDSGLSLSNNPIKARL